MRRARSGAVAALLATAWLAPGCLLGGPSGPEPRYWVLEALPGSPEGGSSDGARSDVVVCVGPFDLPAYLDRSEVVTRTQSSELVFSDSDTWGEPLRRSFSEVLGRDLQALVPGTVAVAFPWKGPLQPALTLSGVVHQFEIADDGHAHLAVSWTLERAGDRALLGRGHWVSQEPLRGSGTEAGVGALSRALADFAREVAKPLADARAAGEG
jgi:uncharacterized protein